LPVNQNETGGKLGREELGVASRETIRNAKIASRSNWDTRRVFHFEAGFPLSHGLGGGFTPPRKRETRRGSSYHELGEKGQAGNASLIAKSGMSRLHSVTRCDSHSVSRGGKRSRNAPGVEKCAHQ
jgi:hypothetical protein